MSKVMIVLALLALKTLQTAFTQNIPVQPDGKVAGQIMEAAKLKSNSQRIGIYETDWATDLVSPRFGAEPGLYTATYNPAALGFIDRDLFFFWMIQPFTPPAETDMHGGTQLLDGYYVKEVTSPQKIGYLFPLGQHVGLGVEFISAGYNWFLMAPYFFNDPDGTPTNTISSSRGLNGGAVSLGYRVTPNTSLGGSVAAWHTGEGGEEWNYMENKGLGFGGVLGYMLQIPRRDLSLSFSAAYAYVDQWYLDVVDIVLRQGNPPLVLEAAMATSLLDEKLDIILTANSDIYIDGRRGHVLRVIPAAEYQLARFFSARAGGDFSYMLRDGDVSYGYGGFAGVSFRFWRIELNGNFKVRVKPSRNLPGQSLQDWALLAGLRIAPGFIER